MGDHVLMIQNVIHYTVINPQRLVNNIVITLYKVGHVMHNLVIRIVIVPPIIAIIAYVMKNVMIM